MRTLCDMRVLCVLCLLLLFMIFNTGRTEQTITIGVVSSDPNLRPMLAAAAEAALSDHPKPKHDDNWQGNVIIASVVPDEAESMPEQVCAQVAQGASAIVAHGKPHEIELTADAAARAGVPLLLVSPTPLTVPPETLERWEAVVMYPQADIFIEACAALCKEKGWVNAVLLHDGPVGARIVQGIADAGAETIILARRLPPLDDDEALRNLLLILKKGEHTQFIVWCDEECCDRLLAEAQMVGLLAERHGYILLALDMHTLDLEPYSHGGANITSLQLFDPTREEAILSAWLDKFVEILQDAEEDAKQQANDIISAPPTALILTYDVVWRSVPALRRLKNADFPVESSSNCAPYLHHADTLINCLRSEVWDGAAGERRAGWLRVAELTRGGLLEPIGTWDRNSVLWRRNTTDDTSLAPGQMTNRTFKFLIAIKKPYVMMKDSPDRLTGNDRYEGFCIELIEKLSQQLNFSYELVQQIGGDYNTMLKRVNDPNDVHFAVTDLTITAEREQKVDFTTPFMNLGISILYNKPDAPDPKLFAFMLPFSTGVWFCLGLAYVGTSLVLYVVGRLCPEEWQNPYPCIEEPEALENQFTLANALWFNLGAVLLQGSEIAPVAYGSRAVASAWWLFALVITSSYTANLATLLAKKNNNQDFTNINELADNELGIKYGALFNLSTYRFFNNSQDPTYKKIFENMQKWDMPKENDAAIERVKKEKFAFFMESTSIEYSVERDCNLTQIGGLLDSKGYGIAMQKNSTYRQSLNLALLNLQEKGELRTMKHRWWKEMNGGGACNDADEFSNAKLTIKNFMGLFLVLGVGCVLGIFISLADLMLAARDKSRDPTASYWRRLADELRFVFHFQQSEKPVNGPLLPPPSPVTEIASETQEEQEAEEDRENIESRMRSASFQSSGPRSRRRSSLHNASMRLARHARRDSSRARTKQNGDA